MTDNTSQTKRTPLPDNTGFRFACNPQVPCFTRCCRDADLLLYPYDIIRLTQHLNMSTDEFLVSHTITAFRENPHFPSVMLKMSDKPDRSCPFLTEAGCEVYENRPFSCRAYPLEPAIQSDGKGGAKISAFLVCHDHCLGHGRGKEWTAAQWMKDQRMAVYNKHNTAWARVASFLRTSNPFGEKGANNPAMNMAYMASYNMDTFRRFVFESSFLNRYDLTSERIDCVKNDDTALMHLGFDWILRFLGHQGPLREKKPG